MRGRRLAAAALLCLAVALGVIGCGGHSGHKRVAAGALSIYTSLPFEGPDAGDAVAIYDGERLALAQAGGAVDGTPVVLRRLDDAGSDAGVSRALVGVSARQAAADPSTTAYIGELTPGSSLPSIRILSGAGILQVSPGDTATGLAGRTFARVVPPDSDEARAQLAAAHRLGIKSLYLVKDTTRYGRDIATAILADAPAAGIAVVDPRGAYLRADTRALVLAIKRSKAGALFYAGSPGGSVAPFWNSVSAADPSLRKFASAAISSGTGWALTTPGARYNTYLSAPGLLPGHGLPRAGSQFETDFVAAYGSHARWASGIFGYVAMSAILEALHSLGHHAKPPRAKLVYAFRHFKNLPSALGPYSVLGGQSSFSSYFFTTYDRVGAPTPYFPASG